MSEVVNPIATILDKALLAVQDSLTSVGRPIPDRIYKAVGEVAYDKEQLTATFVQAYYGSPGEQAETPTQCDGPKTVVITVELVRCQPTRNSKKTGAAPEADTIDAWGEDLLMDMDALLQSVNYFPNLRGVMGDVSVNGPSGGVAGLILNLVIDYAMAYE